MQTTGVALRCVLALAWHLRLTLMTPGWQVQGGNTHKIVQDEHGTKVSIWEPQDQFSVFSSYRLQGALEPLTLGWWT